MATSNVRKSCPRCGGALVVRKNGTTGGEFLGCSMFPDCKYSEPMTEDVLMRRVGAADLFAWAEGQAGHALPTD